MFFKCKGKWDFSFRMKNTLQFVLEYLDFIFVNDNCIVIENIKIK